jgi:hypothetical protein
MLYCSTSAYVSEVIEASVEVYAHMHDGGSYLYDIVVVVACFLLFCSFPAIRINRASRLSVLDMLYCRPEDNISIDRDQGEITDSFVNQFLITIKAFVDFAFITTSRLPYIQLSRVDNFPGRSPQLNTSTCS